MSLDAYTPVDPPEYRLVTLTPCLCGSQWCPPDEVEVATGTYAEMFELGKDTPNSAVQQLTEWTSRQWKVVK